MCPMRNSKFPLRLEVCLLLVAGCVISFLEVSFTWTHLALQSGTPSATAADRFLQQSTWGPTPDSISVCRRWVTISSCRSSLAHRCRAIRRCRWFRPLQPVTVRQVQFGRERTTRCIQFKRDSLQTHCTESYNEDQHLIYNHRLLVFVLCVDAVSTWRCTASRGPTLHS